ncbi:MAG: RNA methyltransferase [Bacteroidetes bacterium]|nr:RNA methyltransferase [Bacteroidota bacterium]
MRKPQSELMKKEGLAFLSGFVSNNKKQLFDKIIRDRTRYITVMVEDLYQPHNISAVLRTCDCFGIQDVHIIENRNRFEVNDDIAVGSSKWLTIKKYDNGNNSVLDAIGLLKKNGYRIIAASPHKNNLSLSDLTLDSRTAFLFGTELEGLSESAIKNADGFIKIPMYGFTESFNISVSVAIVLHEITQKLRSSEIKWHLNEHEVTEIKLGWIKNVIKRAELYEERFLKNL